MIDVAVLRAMAAAGATVDVIIAAVEAQQQAELAKLEERRRQDRERKRLARSAGIQRTAPDTAGHPRNPQDGLDPPKERKEPKERNTPPASSSLRSEAPEGELKLGSDPDADLFRRGREVLGKSAGAMIAQLKRAKNGNIAHARAAIEQASTKENPREYLMRIIHTGPDPPKAQVIV